MDWSNDGRTCQERLVRNTSYECSKMGFVEKSLVRGGHHMVFLDGFFSKAMMVSNLRWRFQIVIGTAVPFVDTRCWCVGLIGPPCGLIYCLFFCPPRF